MQTICAEHSMERYITKRYVAICWPEAIRLASLDGTPLDDIRCDRNMQLIHRTDWWAWWSDERLTTAIALPELIRPQALSTDAVGLIFDVWSGTLARPQCGWAALARVKRIISRRRAVGVGLAGDSGDTVWNRLEIEWIEGCREVLWSCFHEDEAGFWYDVMVERPELINTR